jgi:hypothetical protein
VLHFIHSYAECHYAECHYDERRYAECNYATFSTKTFHLIFYETSYLNEATILNTPF